MNTAEYLKAQFDEHADILGSTLEAVEQPFCTLLDACVDSIRGGGKIVLFGNGGSASDAQHLATEFTVRFIETRPAIAAIALTTDTSALTAIGNDFGFDHLFSRQVGALCKPGDVVIGISTSGRSTNVIEGLRKAREMGCTAAAFTGHDGGTIADIADPPLNVPSKTTARIQEMHILIGQTLCGAVEKQLGYV